MLYPLPRGRGSYAPMVILKSLDFWKDDHEHITQEKLKIKERVLNYLL